MAMSIYFSCQLFHCSTLCCHICDGMFSVFPYVHFHVTSVASHVTEFLIFILKRSCFLGI